jgi:hypothetical protein
MITDTKKSVGISCSKRLPRNGSIQDRALTSVVVTGHAEARPLPSA